MMSGSLKLVSCVLFIFLLACKNDSGSGDRATSAEAAVQSQSGTNDSASSSVELIKVYRLDGSIQCEEGGISLEIMQAQLTDTGIDVICAQTGHDGLARMAVCGAGTGKINIYTIHQSNLMDAESLGFKDVKDLESYQDTECKPK